MNDIISLVQAVPVWVITSILCVAGLTVAWRCLRQGSRLWAALAVAVVPIALVLVVVGPTPVIAREGASLQNFGARANFLERYDANRMLYGQPIGECGIRQTLMTCWTVSTRMEAHPEHADPKYFIENGNLGAELLATRHLERERDPIVPPILLSYFAVEAQRGNDPLYWVGYPLTNPRVVGERTEQYFDKIVLSWPTGSSDPADIVREPVGRQVWSLEHNQGDPVNPPQWTQLRIAISAIAFVALITSFLASRLVRRRRGMSGIEI